MRPALWQPPVECSPAEQQIIARIRRAKLFVFLRQYRHEIFDAALQTELAEGYVDSSQGQPPIPPAQLALATILQAYTGVSDDEVIEATVMDRRWQVALDCLDCDTAPFSKGTLVGFRTRLIEQNWDRRLIERTVEVAAQHKSFGPRPLRAALDSSPLWGAGRVEDTYNLLGHALRKALSVIARQQGRGLAAVAEEAGAALLGGSSLKAALDLNWDEPVACAQALTIILTTLEMVETYVGQQPLPPAEAAAVTASLAVAEQVRAQDVITPATGQALLRQGVAPDRRISVEDADMRHGRKSASRLIDGYKRHLLHDLDSALVRAVGLTPANTPEAGVTDAIMADLAVQQVVLRELHIDRAYLSSTVVRERSPELAIYCKAWPVRHGSHFAKTAFTLDWERHTIRCPHAVELPFEPGGSVHFPAATCAACPLREQCTASATGRSVSIHPDERLLQELRERQLTPQGRAKLRERVAIEHDLAHVGHWQGDRARYCGQRKNLFDLRRCAVVQNLHVISHADRHNQAATIT
jgi:transposase